MCNLKFATPYIMNKKGKKGDLLLKTAFACHFEK